MCNIEVGNFDYSLNEKGEWIYKAKEPEAFKKDGTLKAQYKELPQFDIIYKIDDHASKLMLNEIKAAKNDILNLLK